MADVGGEPAGTDSAGQQPVLDVAAGTAVPETSSAPTSQTEGTAAEALGGTKAPVSVIEAATTTQGAAADAPVGTPNAAPACLPSLGVPTPASNPKKKRKVAMIMAYVGHGYSGMQRNPGVKTIEDDLFRAIHAAGGISEANADEAGYSKIHWMRAARTDKGVSAVGQVVSLRMVLEDPEIQAKINAQLPSQIRVFGFGRATHGFDARKHCDKRRYEYILPAWAFDPALVPESSLLAGDTAPAAGPAADAIADEAAAAPAADDAVAATGDNDESSSAKPTATDESTQTETNPGLEERDTGVSEPAAAAGAGQDNDGNTNGDDEEDEEEPCVPIDPEAAAELQAKLSSAETGFVFDDTCTDRMSDILKAFQGTHNFHNFTVGTAVNAPNARRYILSFKCHGTFAIDGQPWVRLVVIGQSFMLHQIRKMVGLAMAVYRGAAPEDAIPMALKARISLNVPMAPDLGLFLDECYYDAYNAQFGKLHGEIHLSDFQEQVDAFKEAELYPHIAARDAKESVNAGWFQTLSDKCYRFRAWRKAAQSSTPLHRSRGQRPGGAPGGQKRSWSAAPAGGPKRTRFGRPKPESKGGGRAGQRKPDPVAAARAAEYSD